MRSLRTIILALLILLPLACVWCGVNLYLGVDDAYAQWGAAEMVIKYMEHHDGHWPPNWEALRADFDAGGGRVGGWSFDRYRGRVFIDFDADPHQLRAQSLASDRVPFRVIRARWTVGVVFGRGPNAMLHDYFRSSAREEPVDLDATRD